MRYYHGIPSPFIQPPFQLYARQDELQDAQQDDASENDPPEGSAPYAAYCDTSRRGRLQRDCVSREYRS